MDMYLVVQMQVDSEHIEYNEKNILLSNTIRVVQADSKESAIGKFVVATQEIKAKQKLKIECYKIEDIIHLLHNEPNKDIPSTH